MENRSFPNNPYPTAASVRGAQPQLRARAAHVPRSLRGRDLIAAVFSLSAIMPLTACDTDHAPQSVESVGPAGGPEAGSSGPAVATTSQAISGAGRVDDSNADPQWPQVLAVQAEGGSCSGTLISPVHVLTAGHCGRGQFVRLDTPAGAGAGALAGRQIRVIRTRILSPTPFSGHDLSLLLLERAVNRTGSVGAPDYAATPVAFTSNWLPTWPATAAGYGMDCDGASYGTRRAVQYSGGFRTYTANTGVLTRFNVGCGGSGYVGPNRGDSGGPLLNGGGRVVGVFSGWSCRNPQGTIGAAGCEGTIEWTRFDQENRDWINAGLTLDFDGDGIVDRSDPLPMLNCQTAPNDPRCPSQKPDLEVVSIREAGCSGPGGDPNVQVEIRNAGNVPGRGWVDVFVGLTSPPPIGRVSRVFRSSNELEPGETQTLLFQVQPGQRTTWVDVLLDTTRSLDELDETNNHEDEFVTFRDCTFN